MTNSPDAVPQGGIGSADYFPNASPRDGVRSLVQEAKSGLAFLGTHALKKYGQHFMIDRKALRFLADAAVRTPGQTVIEIGPGLGFLTGLLLERSERVWAIEKDRRLAVFLREKYKDKLFSVLEKDVLKVDLIKDLSVLFPVTVVGNIPYNITSPILEWMIRQSELISRGILTVQWELAKRLCASPGSKEWGALSVFVQFHSSPKILKRLGRTCFYPSPKVDSAVIGLEGFGRKRVVVRQEALFFRIVRKSFQKRRKTLINSLADETDKLFSKPRLLTACYRALIDPARRAETLSIEQWASLSEAIADAS